LAVNAQQRLSGTKAMNMKPLESITYDEIREHPVWRFSSRECDNDTLLAPVKRIPCSNVRGKIVGTQVELANGSQAWAFLGNIDPSSPRLTEHFVTISLHHGGKWFHLARYHDYDYADRGPKQLAEFMELSEDEVFPIRYDIREFVRTTDCEALAGTIVREPRNKLTRAEIIAIAVP